MTKTLVTATRDHRFFGRLGDSAAFFRKGVRSYSARWVTIEARAISNREPGSNGSVVTKGGLHRRCRRPQSLQRREAQACDRRGPQLGPM